MKRIVALFNILAIFLVAAFTGSVLAGATQETVTISTSKPLGPGLGTFSASGAVSDSGTLVTVGRHFSAIPAPQHLVTHLVLRFEGSQGTFTIRTQIIETPTEDPAVFTDEGVWAIVDGTDGYSGLHGTGIVVGTVDDIANLITRVFNGTIHFSQ